jgi:hypothetical protein
MTLDLVIRGGTVVDGTGMPRYRADVGVADGAIVSIGRIAERGAQEIDAEGKVVAPGFIDGHTHFDAQICWDPLGTSSSYHGVTSVIMGNCGFTIAPCRETEMDLALRSLERAEDMSRPQVLGYEALMLLLAVPWVRELFTDGRRAWGWAAVALLVLQVVPFPMFQKAGFEFHRPLGVALFALLVLTGPPGAKPPAASNGPPG